MTSPSRNERVGVLLLVLVGFGLRAFRLDVQSIWYDEGFSINLARHGVATIVGLAVDDIHPPLHALLLHFWMLLAGDAEYSTRFLSLFFGVATIAVIFQLGRLLSSGRGAVLSLMVAVLAPFLVYYSQETRPYSAGLFFLVLAVFACLKWVRGSRSQAWLVCYIAATVAAVYTHYYAWLIVAVLNLFVVLRVWPPGRRAIGELRSWLVAQVFVGVAFLPWAGTLLQKYSTYSTPLPAPDLGNVLYQILASFGLGYTAGQAGVDPAQKDLSPDHWIVLALALALLAVAICGLLRRKLPTSPEKGVLGRAFLSLYLAVPIVLIILLSWGQRYLEPRYFIFAAPAYYLLMGRGMDSLFGRRSILGAMALFLVLGASSLSLHNYYFDSTYWRDDVRGTAQFIQSHLGDNDAIILDAYYLRHTFMYYYHGNAPVVDLPAQMPADWDQDLLALQELARRYDRVWVVLWQDYFTDPQRRVQGWLDKEGIRFQHKGFRGLINVLGYLTHPPIVEGTPPGQPVGLQLSSTMQLAASQLPKGPVCAGGEADFTIYWRALRPLSVNYTVFAHLVDEQGRTVAQADSQPANGGYPTTRWPVDSLVADERWIGIPADARPGQYYLEVGMYDQATMDRLGADGPGPSQYRLGPFQVLSSGVRGQATHGGNGVPAC
ncbi:MAG: glycosyltransferase family 39 protein [Dehalococcoidia bacterium]|nr:glycosyltransferase family 39 protein [Dehalococcoidia bacterium]